MVIRRMARLQPELPAGYRSRRNHVDNALFMTEPSVDMITPRPIPGRKFRLQPELPAGYRSRRNHVDAGLGHEQRIVDMITPRPIPGRKFGLQPGHSPNNHFR